MNRALIAAAAILATVSPVAAKKNKVVFLETAVVKDQPVVALDPAKAYILIRSDSPLPLHLMRMPSAEDQVKYDALRSEALVESREKYAKKKVAYDKAKAAYDKWPKGSAKPVLPEKPIEPTEENFQYPAFGLLTGVAIGPLFRFAKGKGGEKISTYLQEVTPGSYRFYGLMTPGLPGGTCFCLGSVAFDAKAGEVTDVGLLASREVEAPAAGDSSRPPVLGLEFRAATADMPVDPRIASAKRSPAVFRPVGKLPNYFGAMIARLPEIPGVMRYERDRIVDLTAKP